MAEMAASGWGIAAGAAKIGDARAAAAKMVEKCMVAGMK
jgi:hypothetical protein